MHKCVPGLATEPSDGDMPSNPRPLAQKSDGHRPSDTRSHALLQGDPTVTGPAIHGHMRSPAIRGPHAMLQSNPTATRPATHADSSSSINGIREDEQQLHPGPQLRCSSRPNPAAGAVRQPDQSAVRSRPMCLLLVAAACRNERMRMKQKT